jgi:DegV family protein with EDD domain
MIAIVTDSTSDLPTDIAQQNQVEIVPLYVHMGGSTFRAGVNLTNEQFLYKLQSSVEMPTTEPPKVEDFQEVYARLLKRYDHIISIHISSKLSKTYEHAKAAQANLNAPNIHIVDSLSLSGGLGLMTMQAARMAAAKESVEAILKQMEMMRAHLRFYFVVNTLEYLQKGGRIGKVRALIGTALQMKPILIIQEGELEPLEQVRTKPKAIARLRQLVIDGLAGRTNVHLSVVHTAVPDEARRLQEDLTAVVEPTYTLFCEAGPIISSHTGPGALVAVFYSDK